MSEAQIANLIKMLNQIVNNNLHHDDVVQIAANHMKRFWALSMKQNIIKYADKNHEGLEDKAKLAVELLAKDYA